MQGLVVHPLSFEENIPSHSWYRWMTLLVCLLYFDDDDIYFYSSAMSPFVLNCVTEDVNGSAMSSQFQISIAACAGISL